MAGTRKYRLDRILATLLGVFGGIWLLLTLVAGFSSGGGNGAALLHGLGALCVLLLSRIGAAIFDMAETTVAAADQPKPAQAPSVAIAVSRNESI